MTEISDRYRDLATEFTRRVDAVPADRWANPSPCEGWSAREVVRHVIDTHGAMPGYTGVSVPADVPGEGLQVPAMAFHWNSEWAPVEPLRHRVVTERELVDRDPSASPETSPLSGHI